MKKTWSIVLIFSTLCMILSPSFAAEPIETTEIVMQDGYAFQIVESKAPDSSVMRSYYAANTMMRASEDEEKGVALLLALGMTEDDIRDMPTSTIMAAANAKDVAVTVAYSKYDGDTNKTVGLPEKTAIEEASILNEKMDEYYVYPEETPELYGIIDSDTDVPGEFKDTYMKITHAAIGNGKGDYIYTTRATWLVMPAFRGFDSIGSCTKGGAVVPYSGRGHYAYDTYFNGKLQSQSGAIPIENMGNPINGDWYGYAGIFNLPNDIVDTESDFVQMHKNLTAYFQYEGKVTHPEEVTNFNSNGCYSHAKLGISFTPSLSVTMNDKVGASIGLSIVGTKDERVAPLIVRYIPS